MRVGSLIGTILDLAKWLELSYLRGDLEESKMYALDISNLGKELYEKLKDGE